MMIEDFISNIVSQFKDPKDDERNTTFYKNITRIANNCKPDCLNKLYNHIIRTEEKTFPFAMGRYYKYIEKNEFEIKRDSKRNPIWNKCTNCGTNYSKNGRGCPKCREHKAEIDTDETLPGNIVEVQEDCFYCTIYTEIKKNPKWMTFKDCNQYGIKQDKTCKPCQCSECCNQMRMYNLEPKQTTEKYKSGELAQPWIKEVDPLNKMAADMLAHMKKTRFKELI